MVHCHLAAYGTVHHRKEGGGELDEVNSALVSGGAEACHVTDHAAAELQQATLSGVVPVEHEAEKLVQIVKRLVPLACLELENGAASALATQLGEHLVLDFCDGGVRADQELVGGEKPESF